MQPSVLECSLSVSVCFALSVFLDDFLATRKGEQAPQLEFEQLPFSHPLFIMFSSGTTGAPKCMCIPLGYVSPPCLLPRGLPAGANGRRSLHCKPPPQPACTPLQRPRHSAPLLLAGVAGGLTLSTGTRSGWCLSPPGWGWRPRCASEAGRALGEPLMKTP